MPNAWKMIHLQRESCERLIALVEARLDAARGSNGSSHILKGTCESAMVVALDLSRAK